MSDILRSYKYELNARNKADAFDLLANIEDNSIATAFLDPQYRGVLDKLKYGNEGRSRGKARCELPQMTESCIIGIIKEINRVLKKSGHLFLWVDKFHLCQGVLSWLVDTDLNIVDMVTWDKGRIGMGYRTRRKSEYVIILQKSPVRAKDCWNDHSIPDVWEEKIVKTHPHSKPIELQSRLILATTAEGDVILDPCAGGYSVLEACKIANRDFIGGDIADGE